MKRLPRLVTMAVAGVTLAACGSSGGSAASRPTAAAPRTATTATSGDPCSLSSAAQVEAAFGGHAGAGTADTATPGRRQCDWHVTGTNLGGAGTVIVFYNSVQSAAAFRAGETGLRGTVHVRGVGDGAYLYAPLDALTLLAGTHVVTVQDDVRGAPASATKHDLTVFATSVAAHL